MSRLWILGTAAALTTPQRDYSHLCWEVVGRLILLDCGTNAFVRLVESGLDPRALGDVVLTHRHIDHMGSLPVLLDQLRLVGRTEPVRVHGLAPTLQTVRGLLDVFAFEGIEQALPISLVEVPVAAGHTVLEGPGFRLLSYPAQHDEPTISLRMELAGGDVVAYSADTGPHPGMAAAYHNCTTLVHECTFPAAAPLGADHCRTVDVGGIAQEAGVARLIVLHLGDTAFVPVEQVRAEIAAHYRGDLVIATDRSSFTFA
jgi:ribonuclease BN (tRNA processing enzyme)